MSRLPSPNEGQFRSRLRAGEVVLPPLRLHWEQPEARGNDGLLRMSWQKKNFTFAAERNPDAGPNAIAANEPRRPVYEVRLGRIKTAVWENESQLGIRYSVTMLPKTIPSLRPRPLKAAHPGVCLVGTLRLPLPWERRTAGSSDPSGVTSPPEAAHGGSTGHRPSATARGQRRAARRIERT